jgi:hypothetical protein
MCTHAIALGGKAANFMICKITSVEETPQGCNYGISAKFHENICRIAGIAFVIGATALWSDHGRFCN